VNLGNQWRSERRDWLGSGSHRGQVDARLAHFAQCGFRIGDSSDGIRDYADSEAQSRRVRDGGAHTVISGESRNAEFVHAPIFQECFEVGVCRLESGVSVEIGGSFLKTYAMRSRRSAGCNSAPGVPAMQCGGHFLKCAVVGGCQSWVATTSGKSSITRLITATTLVKTAGKEPAR